MEYPTLLKDIADNKKINILSRDRHNNNEWYLTVGKDDFASLCLLLHKRLNSPVMMFFAEDQRAKFVLYCVFLYEQERAWIVVSQDVPSAHPRGLKSDARK